MEKVPAERWQQMETDGNRSCAFSEQRHVIDISAERSDICLNPLETHQLVKQAHVARSTRVVKTEEPEGSDAVTDRHDHDVVLGR